MKNELIEYNHWYENGMLGRKAYIIHGKYYNINGPADIFFEENGKIWRKYYYFNKEHINNRMPKLSWLNYIKNI